ncbi:MAG: hypothetical protein JOY71_06120 [Acetobacteraceae bacterium]|nr:hypothetical protein [Acetobacteraceae bacterium]
MSFVIKVNGVEYEAPDDVVITHNLAHQTIKFSRQKPSSAPGAGSAPMLITAQRKEAKPVPNKPKKSPSQLSKAEIEDKVLEYLRAADGPSNVRSIIWDLWGQGTSGKFRQLVHAAAREMSDAGKLRRIESKVRGGQDKFEIVQSPKSEPPAAHSEAHAV